MSGLMRETGGKAGLLPRITANVTAVFRLLRRTPRRPYPRSTGGVAGVVISGLAVAVLMVVLMFTVDAPAITAARQLPFMMHRVFGEITNFGKSGYFLWPIGVMLAVLSVMTRPRLGRSVELVVTAFAVRLTVLFTAIAVPGLFTAIVKDIIGRARPFVGGSANPFLYQPFAWKPAYASLPSGHTTTAVAAAVAIGLLWPSSRPYVWIYALLIAISRLVITAHHPSDIIGGAAVGSVGAVLVCKWFAARRLAFAVAPDGRYHAMPGPSWVRLKRVAARLFRP